MLNYINLKHKPGEEELIAEYRVTPKKGNTLKKAAEQIAAESSIGTWTELSTMKPVIANKLKPSVFSINNKTGVIKIAYSPELFEPGNMPQILSSIAGNIFGMKAVDKLKLIDIRFPKKILKKFKGPKFGIRGIRRITGIKNRPLIGTIVKPKVGLNPKQHAKVAYNAWVGGLDIVKDDENLTNMSFNQFKKRMDETFRLRDKAEEETGQKKIYMPNITAETMEMKARADYIKELGGEYMMIDILTSGWAALQTMRNLNEELKLVIHAHRAMHGAFTRLHDHGISMLTIAKCARAIGVDQLHIGTAAIGKMHGSKSEELELEAEIESTNFKHHHLALTQDWHSIKPVLAVASGGLSPLSTPRLIKTMGYDIVAQYGGGCHGHPDGTFAGARAIKQSLDATLKKIPLKTYAKTHKELARAIEKWS